MGSPSASRDPRAKVAAMEPNMDDVAQQPEQPSAPRKRRRSRAAPLLIGVLLGAVGAIVIAFIVWAVAFREPAIPPLTKAALDAAIARWDRFGPQGYDLEIRLSGARTAEIEVEVRDGEATRVTRDGQLLSQRRLWHPWTVLGQFDTLELELANAERPGEVYSAPEAQVVLRTSFDEQLGYPQRFQRRVLGTRYAIQWEVTRFRIVD